MHEAYGEDENIMPLLLLIVVVMLSLIGVAPVWPHAKQWGYWPSGALSVLLLVLVLLLLSGLL